MQAIEHAKTIEPQMIAHLCFFFILSIFSLDNLGLGLIDINITIYQNDLKQNYKESRQKD